jgi:hypothetical protein
MNRAHPVIVRACSRPAFRAGAWIIGLAVVWMAVSPRPMWGQWNGTNPVWTNNSVGIGTSTPASLLHVVSAGNTIGTFGPKTSSGALDIVGNDGNPWGYANISENATLSSGSWTLRDSTREGWALGFSSTSGPWGGIGFVHFAQGSAAPSTFMNIASTGNVGIGTNNPQHLLHVAGTIGAEEVLVTSTGADYVFRPGYRLQPLSEVAAYIQANHHLPDIPSEAEVKQKGMGVGAMEAKLLAKVEELTLHMIQADKENRELRDRLARLEKGAATSATTAAAK